MTEYGERLLTMELYAWVGEDELGSGEMGLKQAMVPAGMIPMVAVKREKVDRSLVETALAVQAALYGKPISLVRFTAVEIIKCLPGEKPND